MDFTRIRTKLNRGEYGMPGDILADVRLIFYNCREYNAPTAPERHAAQKLSKHFEKRLKDLSLSSLASFSATEKGGAKKTTRQRKKTA